MSEEEIQDKKEEAKVPTATAKKKKATPKKVATSASKPRNNGDSISALPERKELKSVAEIFAMISDVTRIQILLSVGNERSVNDICIEINMSQPAISHHIALLRHSGMIEAGRRGKQIFYELTDNGKSAVKVVKTFLPD